MRTARIATPVVVTPAQAGVHGSQYAGSVYRSRAAGENAKLVCGGSNGPGGRAGGGASKTGEDGLARDAGAIRKVV